MRKHEIYLIISNMKRTQLHMMIHAISIWFQQAEWKNVFVPHISMEVEQMQELNFN